MDDRLYGIELFQFDIQRCYHQERGELENCRYGLLKITCGGQSGWGEGIMSVGSPRFDFMHWASFLFTLRRMPIQDALAMLSSPHLSWEASQLELAARTLSELGARLQMRQLAGMAQDKVSYPIAIGSGILPDAGLQEFYRDNYPPGGYESDIQTRPTILSKHLGCKYGTGSQEDVDRLFHVSRAYLAVL
ncbi:hypothetical protein [Paenibacillus spongiae]|uniref:Mandelate racemase/muconate lactonizing enzyme N-terminal domain-containing protein n=1 Tax=Paenibacillus spongiae TaxID=2909671 RepID=A0ABY5SA29_9BACL|nr:hypothetical protein [Paenibacillus spongiae]UVI30787.1 hypothetical protein L1F29_02600 [Paenibacillus spongiae]